MQPITAIFSDIGGVLLSNGWDHQARQRAAETFHLNKAEMDERHHLTFDTYETGKLSLDEYLNRVVFYEPRTFTPEQFRNFMFAQSQPYPDMLTLLHALKRRYGCKLLAVSNEGRELTLHRIRAFRLDTLFDGFISSCFVHLRKPDADIYRMALDVAQSAPEQTLYIDDRAMFVDVAVSLGLRGVQHTDLAATQAALAALGLTAA